MAWVKVSARTYMDTARPRTSIQKRPIKGWTVFHGGHVVRDFPTLKAAKSWAGRNIKRVKDTKHASSVNVYTSSRPR